jgi:predicted 3-demethylubiquinone-9 3-methyltransferase (glyoxalase superfamily)
MNKITPFLWFDDQAEEAVKKYTSVFPNSKINALNRLGDDVPGPKGKVMTISFQLAGQKFTALNGGPEFSFTPAVSFFVYCQTESEVDSLWNQLSENGKVLMELSKYPFSEKFGWVMDQYGVSWQINLTRSAPKINPFLLFVGKQHGKAEEAIHFYTSLFKNSKIDQIVHFGENEGEPAGAVQHARFLLDGQEFMAMESNQGHAFTFTPAISFFVHCKNQAEVDYFWEKLSEGGEKSQCGWLTDKFGVSWQIVPDRLIELMSDSDSEKANRVTQAMLKMTKIEIGLLEQAYSQG